MELSNSEYYTYQFYTWEFRGRGWFIANQPVYLEPPFIPFFRHRARPTYIDEGRKHTLVSKIIEVVKGKKQQPSNEDDVFDYEELEPFVYEQEPHLAAVQIKFPQERKITPERMKALLIMLSHFEVSCSFEIIGDAKAIIIQFVCSEYDTSSLETYISAYFPECNVVPAEQYNKILKADFETAVIDFGLQQEFVRPLYMPKNFAIDPLIAVCGILERLRDNERGGIQILFQGVINDWSDSIMNGVMLPDGTSFFTDEPDAPKIAFEKIQSPLFGVTLRAFAQADNQNEAFHILENLSNVIINSSRSSTNQLMPLPNEDYEFQMRLDDICLRQSHRIGMLLNADELITFLHFPSESILSRKLFGTSRKTKAAPAIAINKQFVLGENTHNGILKAVSIGLEDRLKHTHIIGATGTGKSTLIANLILQDIRNEMCVVLFDPHGDLVDDILSHIPQSQLENVVLIDPSDTDFPISINILQAHSDIEKEVLSSDLVASFRKYATSWGDQMNSVLGNAIQAILENPHGGTLHDLRRFLIEKDFRTSFLQSVNDPAILYYWEKEYPLLKTNSIGPIVTRLDTFLRPRLIRNMVIQKAGIDFEALLNSNKIILLKLSQGLMGTENSYLLGSLLLSKIHQVFLSRQQQSKRNPVMIYLDEFQNFITPSIKDMLSGIRKYNVGLTLSHQDLQQLHQEDSQLLNSVLGNIHTRIVFRVGEPDAKKLQDGFSDFDFHDLQNLSRGEAIIRIEQPKFDCSLNTVPLENVSVEMRQANISTVLVQSRNNYAQTKQDVERELNQSFNFSEPDRRTTVTDLEVKIPQEFVKEEETHPDKSTVPKSPPPIAEEKDISTHRYLQTLVKKMGEDAGYTAIIEMQLPQADGQVDVLLTKDSKTIAVEICNTTDADWEMHNISKCLAAKYDMVISLSGDLRQLEKIRKKCSEGIPEFEKQNVLFLSPDALFSFLRNADNKAIPQNENIVKGYRINVSYEPVTHEEMKSKRASVAQIVMGSIKKRKK